MHEFIDFKHTINSRLSHTETNVIKKTKNKLSNNMSPHLIYVVIKKIITMSVDSSYFFHPFKIYVQNNLKLKISQTVKAIEPSLIASIMFLLCYYIIYIIHSI